VKHNVIALGSFDGIHAGHSAVVGAALALDSSAAVICFEPLPRQVFSPIGSRIRLTTPLERMKVLRAAGVGPIIALPFDSITRCAHAPDFLDNLRGLCGFGQLVVGYDFHFGRDRSGNVERLSEWCSMTGIGLVVVPEVTSGGSAVKSERIRARIRGGALPEAGILLGRRYAAIGAVARGRGVGRGLGFPTLNVRIPDCKLLPPPGSYAAFARIGDGPGRAAAVFVPEAPGLLEAHLPGWSGDAYSEAVGVEFIEPLRPAERGLDRETLRRRIEGDVERAMEVAQE
jgi:riboflavin kinase / FMN adenylyltransferase